MVKKLAMAIAASIMATGISLPRVSAAETTVIVPLNPQGVLKPEPFSDVPSDHWAYNAVEFLRQVGLAEGYPDGTFRGKRPMTRYEFAQVIERMVRGLLTRIGERGVGPTEGGVTTEELNRRLAELEGKIPSDERIRQLIREEVKPGVTREEFAALQRLVNEFRDELARRGVEVDTLKRDLAALRGRVDAIEAYLAKLPVIYGNANFMPKGSWKSDQVAVPGPVAGQFRPVLDHDGRPLTDDTNVLTPVLPYYDLDLGIKAQPSSSVRVGAALNVGNYLSSYGAPLFHGYASEGGDVVTPYKVFVNVPFRFLGSNDLTVGRQGDQLTPYTFWAIDPDTYTYVPREDSGEVVFTGLNTTWRFGGLKLRAFTGVNPKDGRLLPLNIYPQLLNATGSVPVFGTTTAFGGGARVGSAPIGAIGNFVAGRLSYGEPEVSPFRAETRPVGTLDEATFKPTTPAGREVAPEVSTPGAATVETPAPEAGFNLGPLRNTVIGVNYLLAAGNGPRSLEDARAQVYSADARFKLAFLRIEGEAAKGMSDTGGAARARALDDSALDVRGFFTLGSLELGGGWRRITMDYVVPGYWGVIGSWKNPRNIEGPMAQVRLPLKWNIASFLRNIALKGSAEFYQGRDVVTAGTTAATDPSEENLRIDRYLGGVEFALTSRNTVDLGVEQVFRNYVPDGVGQAPLALPTMGVAGSPLAGTRIKNTETYINFGIGHNFTPDIAAKLLYQLVDFQRDRVDNSNQPANYRGYVATAQVGVRF